jgi:hypothetical protein
MVDDWFSDSYQNELPKDKFFLAKGKLRSVLLLFGNLDGAAYHDEFSIIKKE